MNRGDIWWVDFEPSVGSEMRKIRPAIIVSNNIANRHLPRVTVMPLTSNTARLYPGEALVTVNGQTSKAMASQIATVDKTRIQRQLGSLSLTDTQKIEHAIKVHLALL